MKKTPLKYILMICFSIPILLIAISIIGRVMVNHNYVKEYDKAKYPIKSEEKLLYLNFPESYLPYYNLGDAYYEKKEYETAVGYFQKALSLYPQPERECSIRINLALSLCNTIDFYDIDSQEKIDTALFVLYKARDTLLENGWAVDEGDNYRDKDAQQLKEDIDKMIEQLKNPDSPEPPQEEQEDKQQSGGGGGGFSNKENQQKEKLDKNKKDAMQDRKDSQQQYENEQKQKQKEKEQQEQNSGEDQQNGDQDQQNGGQDQENGGQDQENGGQDKDKGDQDQENGGQDQNGDQEGNGGQDQGDQNNGDGENEQNGGGGGDGQGQGGNGGNAQGYYGVEEEESGIYIKQW